jgi:hypothetical protein
MFGRWITGLIVVGLAVGVWALWPREDPGATTTTVASTSSTTSTSNPTTTTAATTTSSGTVGDPEIIETVEEAEEVLRDLWFGWFEGIYNQDEDRIKEVVASQSQLDAAIAAFGVASFTSEPTREGIVISGTEILRSDAECLAVESTLDVSSFRGPGSSTSSVEVLRVSDGQWKFAASWSHAADLWEQDCEAQLEPLS